MSDWGYNNHNSYGSNHEENHNDDINDGMDDLLSGNNNDINTASSDSEAVESSDDTNTQNSDDNSSENITNDVSEVESLENLIVSAPANTSAEPKFSEKDVYRLTNVITMLDNLSDEIKKWLDTILNIGGADIRRAMTIVSNGAAELDSKTSSIWVLNMVANLVNEEDSMKAITDTIEVIKVIEDMESDDRIAFINFARRIARDNSEDKKISIKVTKNSSSAEIVSELRQMFTDHPEVSTSIAGFTSVVDLLKKSLH